MRLQISSSERDIMRSIWQMGGSATVAPLLDELSLMGKQWKSSTVVSFLARLVEKGLLLVEKNGRNNIYIASLSKIEFQERQTKDFLAETYDGNVDALASFLSIHGSTLIQDIPSSKVIEGELFVEQYLFSKSDSPARVTVHDILRVLRTEVAARKASINTKRKTVITLEHEIRKDEQRIDELHQLIEKLYCD